MRIRDVNLEDFNPTEGNRGTWQFLECLDADGQPVAPRIPIVTRLPDPAQSPVDPDWFQVVDVPVATARFAITDQEFQGFEFLSVADDGIGFQPGLAAHPGSGALTGPITLDFSPNVGGKPLPVFHQLYYSADGRQTWVPIGEMTTDQTVMIEARDLPATDDLAFKVVAADAFRSAQAQLTGFRVGNRAPVVRILSPKPGDAAEAGQAWFLSAEAFDLEDGLLVEGTWHSSRDGLLGTNAILSSVRLSAGTHTLQFAATDAAGLAGSGSIQVSVGTVAAANLALGEDSLRIRPAGSDPLEPTPNRLQTGRLNLIRVTVRNGGLTNEARLSLYLTLENAPEVLLASTAVTNWAPFMPGSLEVPYVFPGANHYSLRAMISDPLVPDPDPADNSRSWSFTNEPPVAAPARFDLTPQHPLDFRLSGTDPDGDSFNNLAEYAHQLNPKVWDFEGGPAASCMAESGIEWLREVQYLVVTYRQRKGGVGNPALDYRVDGVRYCLEYNDSLDDSIAWAGGDRVFEVLESWRVDNGDGSEWISVRCRIPITDNPGGQGYVRLRLTLP